MVNKLRNKFVVVTTSLMLVVFGGFLIINTYYNNYWNDMDMEKMLVLISRSGFFSMKEGIDTSNTLVEDMTEDYNPIVGIILDSDMKVIKKQMIGNDKEVNISQETLEKMLKNKHKNKLGKYYYAYSELENNQCLLVVMDSSMNERIWLKIVGVTALGLFAVFLLIIITQYLSGFVTKPAEQSLLREKQFISDASHELKTPLGAISINAQAMQLGDENNLYVNNIISEADRMNRLIERLLTLSKLEEAPETELEDISLSDLCEEMVLTYESVAFESGIQFEYEIEKNISMKGVEDEIRQLIAILIDNAIKNSAESGKIDIRCLQRKRQKLVSVSNTGEGICQEDLPHVFERFYTSDKARKNNSFGLGLAIAKTIVDKHKGNITVESIQGEKTTFRVWF